MLSLMACCSTIMHSLHLSQLKSISMCFCLHPYHSHSVIFIILKPSLHMLLQIRFTAKANTLRHTMPRRINMYLSTSELAQVYTLQCIPQKAASHLKCKLAERESTHNGVNKRSKHATKVQQRPESSTVSLTWHVCKYKVHKHACQFRVTVGNPGLCCLLVLHILSAN